MFLVTPTICPPMIEPGQSSLGKATGYGLHDRRVGRMPSSVMLCRIALLRTNVSDERVASIIRVTRIAELGTILAVTNNRNTLRRNDICHTDDGDTFLRNVGSYNSHPA
jgi:hypothetical protein